MRPHSRLAPRLPPHRHLRHLRRLAATLLALALPVASGCAGVGGAAPDGAGVQAGASAEALQGALPGTWWHSHEEDAEGLQVYRREGYAFPPARGREGFSLEAGGGFVLLGIAPADGTERTGGRWRLEGSSLRATLTDGTTRTWQLLSLEGDVLRVRP